MARKKVTREKESPSTSGLDMKVVSLPPACTVDRVAAVREEILEAFQASSTVLVSVSQVERIDLAGVHLLYSAKREAVRRGRTMLLSGDVPEALGTALVTGGFCVSVPHGAPELEALLLEFAGNDKVEPGNSADKA
ncbi:MAG: lipid asymmetry maintenance protein MlaB [Spirochaetaceae bacterium]